MRVEVCQGCDDDGETIYRLREADGELVDCWAPGIENRDPLGALDRGGFSERGDAVAFSLGVDRWRAEVGLIEQTVADIDAERHALDSYGGGKGRCKPSAPEVVVTYRRRPAA